MFVDAHLELNGSRVFSHIFQLNFRGSPLLATGRNACITEPTVFGIIPRVFDIMNIMSVPLAYSFINLVSNSIKLWQLVFPSRQNLLINLKSRDSRTNGIFVMAFSAWTNDVPGAEPHSGNSVTHSTMARTVQHGVISKKCPSAWIDDEAEPSPVKRLGNFLIHMKISQNDFDEPL